jgi:hypothetical protein
VECPTTVRPTSSPQDLSMRSAQDIHAERRSLYQHLADDDFNIATFQRALRHLVRQVPKLFHNRLDVILDSYVVAG